MSQAKNGAHLETGSEALPAGFGLATAAFVVVASMVGTGVLATSGFTVDSVGSNQLMLVLWVVGGIAALCAALTLAELSAALPRAGGDYVILYEAYGPLAAFLAGWVTFLLGNAAPIAVSASASASYLLAPLKLSGTNAWLAEGGVASLAIVVFALVHISGQRRSVRVQVAITLLKLALLLVYLFAGLAAGWRHTANLADLPHVDLQTAGNMTFSLVFITYAYFGWNAASYLAGEIAQPGRDLPRAIGLGTAAVVLLYLGLNVVYALALPAKEVHQIAVDKGPNAVGPIAELAAARLFGADWAARFSVAIGLMLLSSVSAYILTGPRVAYAMAKAGQFPLIAGQLSKRFQTPAIATGVLAALSLALLWSGSFKAVMTYASLGMALFSILTIASVYVLRVRRPDLQRPFRTPGYPLVPAVYIVISAALSVAVIVKQTEIAAWSMATIVAGVPFYYIWRSMRRGPKPPDPGNTRNEPPPL
jgi:APA family basic amino acid/polyamine antiporter